MPDDPPKVGQERNGVVYELFVSTVQAPVLTAKDLLDVYRHRGSFETVLADEDEEQGIPILLIIPENGRDIGYRRTTCPGVATAQIGFPECSSLV